jgi:hypothetical protein
MKIEIKKTTTKNKRRSVWLVNKKRVK